MPGELARLLQQEERAIQPHEESVEVVNLGTDKDRKEIKKFQQMQTETKSEQMHIWSQIWQTPGIRCQW